MGRVAVVTGGASGVGRSVCERLASDGCAVAVLDLAAEHATQTADELRAGGAIARAAGVDVSDREALDEALHGVRSTLGPIDIVVTSAAVATFTPFEEIDVDEFERMLRVNLLGTFHCIQLAIPDMVAAGWGRIVTISSAAGQAGSALQAHYSATKGAVIAMTKAIALEYAARGITANTVPPFMVDTPMFRAAQAGDFLPSDEHLARMVPARRIADANDIAPVVGFLCSEGAGHVTGQTISANGGAITT